MKRFITLFLILTMTAGFAGSAYAQKMSKEEKKKVKTEKKAWKKKAKTYAKSPLSLRDDLESKDAQMKKLAATNSDLQRKLSACGTGMDSIQDLFNRKSAEIAAMDAKYQKLQAAYEAQKNVNDKGIIPGLVYKVQVGAFVHFDINAYLKDTENFEGETADGMNKYTIGNFKEFDLAEAFRKDIATMGIKDAWIVPYIDGQRVTHQEARDYLDQQGK